MRDLYRPIRCLTALALAIAFPALAQAPAETPAPQAPGTERVQPAPEEPGVSAAMRDSARIALCHKKMGKPLEPADWNPPPSPVGGDVAPPRSIYRVAPSFPRRDAEGMILLKAVIDEDGCVRQVEIARGLGKAQDAAALEAIRQWVFRPATFKGRPIRVFYTTTLGYDRWIEQTP